MPFNKLYENMEHFDMQLLYSVSKRASRCLGRLEDLGPRCVPPV